MYKIILALLVSLLQLGCKEETPVKPPDNGESPEITLTIEDATCTEIWLSVKIDTLPSLAEISLFKDEVLLFNITGTNLDTLLYEENLTLYSSYLYRVKVNYKEKEYSNSIAVTTLQPTSQNFTWQTFTFGDQSNSIFRDVFVIDENNIWAVGEIRIADTSANGYTRYSYMKWNGIEWKAGMLRYFPPGSFGDSITTQGYSIFAFNENDVWISGGAIFHWDGSNWQIFYNTGAEGANKIWGTSSSDLFFVNINGNITRYNNGNWTSMQSGTTVDLLDIYGSPDGTIWACGYNSEDAFTALLRYDGIQWNKVYEGSPDNQNNNEYIGPISGVWSNSKFFTYVVSWGKIYRQPNDNILDIKRITPNFSDVAFAMRGTDHNNIFIAGQHGLVGHFNGVTYTEFNELKESAKNYLAVAVKDNIAVAAGIKYGGFSSQAVITLIKK